MYVDTVMDNLYATKAIREDVFGVYFKPLPGSVSARFPPNVEPFEWTSGMLRNIEDKREERRDHPRGCRPFQIHRLSDIRPPDESLSLLGILGDRH